MCLFCTTKQTGFYSLLWLYITTNLHAVQIVFYSCFIIAFSFPFSFSFILYIYSILLYILLLYIYSTYFLLYAFSLCL